jgi:hypothetical protein
MLEGEVPTLMRSLLAAGFQVTSVERKPNYLALHLVRADELGIGIKYVLAYAGDSPISSADAEGLRKLAAREGAALVIISSGANIAAELVVLTKAELFGKLGGVVSSILPFEPEYGTQLITLSQNILPVGLQGVPDDLFEAYVHAGLQFLLRGRVIRYGQDRRFEALPDGLILTSSAPLMLYDCKAADPKYEFSRTAIRQFADYVKQFHARYEAYVGRLYAFVALSCAFQDFETIRGRSNELYAECGVPIVCVTSTTLAAVVSLFTERPVFRSLVDWKSIFVPPIVELEMVRKAMEARQRDRVVRG